MIRSHTIALTNNKAGFFFHFLHSVFFFFLFSKFMPFCNLKDLTILDVFPHFLQIGKYWLQFSCRFYIFFFFRLNPVPIQFQFQRENSTWWELLDIRNPSCLCLVSPILSYCANAVQFPNVHFSFITM